jgi:hypothetical protein
VKEGDCHLLAGGEGTCSIVSPMERPHRLERVLGHGSTNLQITLYFR